MKEKDIKFAHENTLKLFSLGCDKLNYELLTRLAKSKKEVVSELTKEYGYGASRMAFNRRINLLEGVGLLERISYKRDIIPTPVTRSFLEVINAIEKQMYRGGKKHLR